jgi:hypothetical protein
MRNNNALVSALGGCLVGCLLAFSGSTVAQNVEPHNSYAFMSAQDLYDALSQESQVALGYLLGIIDARKGRQPDGSCYTVPWQFDADKVLVSVYLEYWPDVADFSMEAPDALIRMMQKRFPCRD